MSIAEDEAAQRRALACVHRMVARNGWDDLVFTHISAPVPAIGPRTFAGEPVTSTSSGIFVPPTTSECAPIKLRARCH